MYIIEINVDKSVVTMPIENLMFYWGLDYTSMWLEHLSLYY